MSYVRLFTLALFMPLAALAADQLLKVDRSRSYVEADVDATVDFVARLENYDARIQLDADGKIKSGVFAFKFADLKTGNPERDAHMIAWLGGGTPVAQFEIGNLALTPDGQGQVSGRFTMHGVTERIEFPINLEKQGGTYIITGQTTLDYRTWNLKKIRKAFIFTVDPEVKVRFKLTGVPVAEPAQ